MKADNAEWLKNKQVNLLLQYALERSPDLPDVPLMAELGKSDDDRRALKVFAMGNAMGRSIMGAPGVPPERTAALQQAFADTMADPELVAFAHERHIDIGPPLDGKGLAKLVEETLSVSPAVVTMVKKARGDI
jgi:tripartite-type tricarboxylate transporter receptor subunit TctC